MASSYYYLVGSLPTPSFSGAMPLGVAELDERCRERLSPPDYAIFAATELPPPDPDDAPAALAGTATARYWEWERALRNAWLDFRKKFRPDALEFKHGNPDYFSEIPSGLATAAATENVLETERQIDKMRFAYLDHLEALHNFDLDRVLIYKLKLRIMEKYASQSVAAGNAALETILSSINPTI